VKSKKALVEVEAACFVNSVPATVQSAAGVGGVADVMIFATAFPMSFPSKIRGSLLRVVPTYVRYKILALRGWRGSGVAKLLLLGAGDPGIPARSHCNGMPSTVEIFAASAAKISDSRKNIIL